MKTALIHVLLFVLFAILFVLPSVFFPFPLPQNNQGSVEGLKLIALLITDFVALIFLIRRINLSGAKLSLAVVVVFWGLQTFMTQIETWYFRDAMPAITNELLLKLFLNPLITVVIFVPVAIRMLGKWKDASLSNPAPDLKLKWKEIAALSFAYVVIYFLFGHYVAWQFPEVRLFYSGSTELLGFFDQFQHTFITRGSIVPFQFLRGLLWILCGLPVIYYLKGTRSEKIAACVFLYAVLTCIQLILDNPFMPAGVRLAHLLEVSASNGLFGLLTGLVLCKREA